MDQLIHVFEGQLNILGPFGNVLLKLRDLMSFLAVHPIGGLDGIPHFAHPPLVEDAAEIAKRAATNEPFHRVAERLVVSFIRLNVFVHVVSETNLTWHACWQR